MNERETLRDLHTRISEKVPMLRDLAHEQGAGTVYRMIQRARLDGKADGLALAASYVDEALRQR